MERLRRGEKLSRYVSCPVQLVRFAEGVDILAVGGELTSGLARVFRQAFPNHPFVMLGYSNGLLCYLHNEEMIQEGGYEVYYAVFYRRELPAPLAPGLEQAFIDTISTLLQAVSENPASAQAG